MAQRVNVWKNKSTERKGGGKLVSPVYILHSTYWATGRFADFRPIIVVIYSAWQLNTFCGGHNLPHWMKFRQGPGLGGFRSRGASGYVRKEGAVAILSSGDLDDFFSIWFVED